MIDHVVALQQKGKLTDETYQKLVDWLCQQPTRREWRATLRWWFLVLGFLLLVSAVIYFGAYNWASLHRFSKFAILELLLVGLSAGVLLRGIDSKEGQVLLVAAATTVGALLAVFGQVYQTGADSFLLFLGWSALIAIWCFVGRSNVLWCLQFILLNVTFVLWYGQRVDNSSLEHFALFYFLLNLTLAGIWAWSQTKFDWMATYPTEALLFTALTPLTLAGAFQFFDFKDITLALPILALALGAMVVFRRSHLASMATVSASLLCLGTALLIRLFIDFEILGILLIGLGVLLELALLVKGLTYVHQQNHKTETSEQDFAFTQEAPTPEKPFGELDLSPEDLTLLSSKSEEMPWYVQTVVGTGAWVASLFVVAFFLIWITQAEFLLLVYGLGLYLGTLRIKQREGHPVFFRHALLSVHLAGAMVTVGGVAEVLDSDGFLSGLTALILMAVSIRSFSDSLGQFLFGVGFFGSGLWVSVSVLDDLGGTLWLIAAAVALSSLSLNQRQVLFSSIRSAWPAVQRGFSAAFLAWSLFPIFESYSSSSEVLLKAGLTLTLLWSAWKLDHPPLVLVGLVIFSALTHSVPTLSAAILVYTLGFTTHQKVIQGLALLTLAGAGSFFYYSLEMTLMAKSITLFASGLTFLGLRLLLGPTPDPEAKNYAL